METLDVQPVQPSEWRDHASLQERLRMAVLRRASWLDDPSYGRVVNGAPDGAPGLFVDRYGSSFVVQTRTHDMDERVVEIGRSLLEVAGASGVLLRNDTSPREDAGLPTSRPHVLLGAPPRWSRVLEMGARLTFDLFGGKEAGYPYEERELRRLIARIGYGARVLDIHCRIGGLFVHAGTHGAKEIVALADEVEDAELARENAEVNGLISKTTVLNGSLVEMMEDDPGKFDLVLFRAPRGDAVPLLRHAVRAVRHGGRLAISAGGERRIRELLALACKVENRHGVILSHAPPPPDFPEILSAAAPPTFEGLLVELS